MTPENWKRIKAIELPAGRMLHTSDGNFSQVTGRFIKGSGSTYNVGRNAKKRQAKET